MGAGASAAKLEDRLDVVEETAKKTDTIIAEVKIEENIDVDEGISTVMNMVSVNQKEAVVRMFGGVKGLMSNEQLLNALEDIKSTLPTVEGDAIVAAIAGSLQAASAMAPAVMVSVGASIIFLGKHLPYVGVAAAAIGAIVYAFKLSKDQDENVATVTLWLHSVKDWMLFVTGKVERCAAASTEALFKGLQDAMLKISDQVQDFGKKWRITKMLRSQTFETDFTRAKSAVLELKSALKDYLDAESQDTQEKSMEQISSTMVDVNEKLSSMDDQLKQIKDLLQKQAEDQKAATDAAAANTMVVRAEEEELYANIQRGAGLSSDKEVPFKHFVMVFESFFFNGATMPSEQRRGLKVCVLERSKESETVSKAAWMKFYRHWISSKIEMEAYLNKTAEDNPTLFTMAVVNLKGAIANVTGIKNVNVSDAKTLLLDSAADCKARLAGRAGAIAGAFFGDPKSNAVGVIENTEGAKSSEVSVVENTEGV